MCDTVVAVRDDRVLFAKNSDRDANEGQVLEWHPRARHPPGATLRCTWLEIPQVARSHATVISRPYWMWGAEMGANEHGVTIGNEAVFTRDRVPRIGLTGMDLLRLALERAVTAEEAVDTILRLADEHGQGGGCGYERRSSRYFSSFLIADPLQAFVLETAGTEHAVERVQAERSISNGLTIAGFAESRGASIRTALAQSGKRRHLTQERAATVRGVRDLMSILRDHGGRRWPAHRWLTGAIGAPCMHAGGLLVGSRTAASWVAELRPDGCNHWITATPAPCLSLFKPITVGEAVDLGPAPSGRADGSLWWRQDLVNRWILRDPEGLAEDFVAQRDAVEGRWLEQPPTPVRAFAEGERLLHSWLERRGDLPVRDVRPWPVRRFWRRRDAEAGV